MAPVCVADRLVLLQVFVLLLLSIIGTKQIESLLVYDRQSLLFIRRNISDLSTFDHGGQYTSPPFLAGIPPHLYRAPGPTFPAQAFPSLR